MADRVAQRDTVRDPELPEMRASGPPLGDALAAFLLDGGRRGEAQRESRTPACRASRAVRLPTHDWPRPPLLPDRMFDADEAV